MTSVHKIIFSKSKNKKQIKALKMQHIFVKKYFVNVTYQIE